MESDEGIPMQIHEALAIAINALDDVSDLLVQVFEAVIPSSEEEN